MAQAEGRLLAVERVVVEVDMVLGNREGGELDVTIGGEQERSDADVDIEVERVSVAVERLQIEGEEDKEEDMLTD